MTHRHLIPLGEGVYTVSQVVRILQPTMTPRKVHYWLNTGLLSEPLVWGRRGQPTLLNFKQLLQVRTVQRMRDELRVPLPKVRDAFAWVIDHAFAEDPSEVRFGVTERNVVATAGDTSIVVLKASAQPMLFSYDWGALNADLAISSRAWAERALPISGTRYLIANARIQGGAPTIKNTRIETSFIASFASEDGRFTRSTVAELRRMHPRLRAVAIREAFRFEGVAAAA